MKPIVVDGVARHSISYVYGIELKTRTRDRNGKYVWGHNGVLYTSEYSVPIEYWERRIPYIAFCREIARATLRGLAQCDGIDPIAGKRIRDLVKGAKVKRIRLSVLTETVTHAQTNRRGKTKRRNSNTH